MNQLSKVDRTKRIQADQINQIIDAVNLLLNLSVGPGLLMQQSGGGITLSLADMRRVQTSSPETDPGGDALVLAHVQDAQDTDTYDRAAAKQPVTLTVVTEVYYDLTSYQLFGRTRTLDFDGLGRLKAVSGESDPVQIAVTDVCNGVIP